MCHLPLHSVLAGYTTAGSTDFHGCFYPMQGASSSTPGVALRGSLHREPLYPPRIDAFRISRRDERPSMMPKGFTWWWLRSFRS